jgi:asparagine synthase (glutamine-hydrolysing)
MSFFAGILSISNERADRYSGELESAIALGDDFTVSRFCDPHLVLFHGFLEGVLPEAGWSIDESTVTAVAGSLHLTTPSIPIDDQDQPELRVITNSLKHGRIRDLCNANGTFALCFYERQSCRLVLAVDCLGARPVYYTISSGLLFFSTSLAVLESLEMVAKTVELATYVEQEALGYPLGDRTIYQEIKVAVANECIIAKDGNVVNEKYFDWAKVPLANDGPDQLAQDCRRALRDAVSCRARAGVKQFALLSGGLDSRVLVTELLDLGYQVDAINVAREGFQDQIYARRFAAVAGIQLSAVPWSPDLIGLTVGDSTARLLEAAVSGLAPGSIFSGDGGGETFGFLLMNSESARLLHEGTRTAAVKEYLNNNQLSKRVFKSNVYQQVSTAANDRMERELISIGCANPEKALHILVLTNDLRCHLHDYFSRIRQSRVELILPFYDRRVIASVMRIPPPLNTFMRHSFYHRIVNLLNPLARVVPWQTYPDHIACPTDDDSPPPDQWSKTRMTGSKWAKVCLRLALSRGLASPLRRSTMFAAAFLHWTRLADYEYLFRTCINTQMLCGNRPYVICDQVFSKSLDTSEEFAR